MSDHSDQNQPFEFAVPASDILEFKQRLVHRLKVLSAEFSSDSFYMPVGIFLLLDKQNGGDATADELMRRFGLLDFESRTSLDFYFLGWRPIDASDKQRGISFDLRSFEEFRDALKKAGLRKFGGNADLILVDAHFSGGKARLNFSEAIRIDLAAGVPEYFASLGHFLQEIIEAAEAIRNSERLSPEPVVWQMSDRLGLIIGKQSLLDFILEKWGKVMGAKGIASLAVRELGPDTPLENL